MQLFAPRYYQRFQCTAAACTHSCCVGWEIDVDEETLARYDALPGALGEEIRAGITRTEDGCFFTLDKEERCPNLRADGLCRIICALGEGYLCDICREHPRFYHTVMGRMECGVGASCEAAAALILSSDAYSDLISVGEVEGKPPAMGGDFDALAWREALYAVLRDASLPYSERLSRIAKICDALLPDTARVCEVLSGLEYLNEAHRLAFSHYTEAPERGGIEPECERFFAYLLYRHASVAETPRELACAVGLALVVERLFAMLCTVFGYSPVEAAVALSEELEYSEENTAALLAICV